ncbi:MAG: GTP-binding protein [Comamonadaceae bacterium]|nr:MAG: GTP-binding protein [Comamonadaceae bacterium]
MKLTRIRIEQLRQFRAPFELAGLDAGLNLFTGPNEAGKSTVVRAIRAAFFERHRSSAVDDLVPYGDTSASPSIEIDFETGGRAHALRKTFLQRKRCQLVIGTQQFDGEEAEQRLAQLLGFEFSQRGASKPEHWGIPGLLWIEQGTGHAIHASVGHATSHLQRALDQSVGEVASTQGDEIAARVRAERDALLTAAGKPRGAYAEALSRRDDLQAEALALDARIELYRRQVDELAGLIATDEDERASRPWEAFEAQLRDARQALLQAQGLAARQGQASAALRRHEEHAALIAQQLQAYEQQSQALAQREAAVGAAGQTLAAGAAARAARQQEREQAGALYARAVRDVASARQQEHRSELARRRADAAQQVAALSKRLAEARIEAAQLVALQGQVAGSGVPDGAIAQLRKLQSRCNELRIRQESASTRLRFVLDGGDLTLDGEPIRGEGERLLAGPARLIVPGQGRIDIVPGQSDVPQLTRELAEQRAEYESRLRRLGVATLEEAEARELRQRQAQADAQLAERSLALLAPQGLAALEAAVEAERHREAEALQQAAALSADEASASASPPAAASASGADTTPAFARAHAPSQAPAQASGVETDSDPSAPVPTLAQALAAQQTARTHLDRVEVDAEAAGSALAAAQAQFDQAVAERDAAAAVLSAPGRSDSIAQAGRRLLETRALQQAAADELVVLERELGAARPEILAQDVQRFERSATQARRSHAERQAQIATLRGNLEATGALGLEETRGELAAKLQAAQRRSSELAERAEALLLLHGLIESRRRAATRRLQAPLQTRIQHYLQLLFPDAVLDIGDDLSPGALLRGGRDGHAAPGTLAAFDTLSFGAREQMALISRLAYADLLKAAGRPTLLILDDALVHTDEQRLARMKRVLYDAAQRHQVLLFTCHPQHWRDLGAAPRPISSAG